MIIKIHNISFVSESYKTIHIFMYDILKYQIQFNYNITTEKETIGSHRLKYNYLLTNNKKLLFGKI